MDWFYDSNGQQTGPVSEAQLDELLGSGTVNLDTLVWRDGMPDWQPMQNARPSLAPPVMSTPPSLPPVIGVAPGTFCVECRRPFAQSDMVFLNKSWVCAQCKPVFLQRLMEGAAPGAGTIASGLVWRWQNQMVTRSGTPLPDRCVRCNAPAKGFRLKRDLGWHPPAYYLLIFAGLLIYIIVAMCVRQKAILHIGLCEMHRTQRKRFIMFSWIAALVGLLLVFAAGIWSSGWPAFLGIVLMLGALLFGLSKAPVISVTKIDKEFVWVKGTSQEFLAELPEWIGPR